MWKKVSKLVIALALSVPMSITVVHAQNAQDADIWSYSQDLQTRILSGRQTGQLSDSDYKSLNSLWTQIDSIRRQYSNKQISQPVRGTMMASLTNLDRLLTDKLHDNDLSHYQNWDPNRQSWSQNWWTGNTGSGGFNDEVDAYQRTLKSRIDRGRSNGQITGYEYGRLMSSYDNIDATQRQYRMGGISNWERNALMTMLTQLDRDVTRQMNDDDQSRYKYWNSSNKSWSQNWWKPGFVFGSNPGGDVLSGGATFNDEIDAYQNDLKQRIDRGRYSGQLSPAELNTLMAAYANIDRTQQEYRSGGFTVSERNSLISSLTQLDRDITQKLRDDDQSRYRYWDPNKNTWNQNWWKNNVGNQYNNPGASAAFNTEVNDEQKRVKELLIRGQRNGHLTAQEIADLNRQFDEIDSLQAQYRNRGFNRSERDTIMQKLRALDNNLTTKLRNADRNANAYQERRDERRDNHWDRWNDRNGPVTTNPPTTGNPPVTNVPPTTNNPPANNDHRGGWGNRDRNDNGAVVTPTTPSGGSNSSNNSNNSNSSNNSGNSNNGGWGHGGDNRGGGGWGGNRNNSNQNSGIVPPSTTPTTPGGPPAATNAQQGQGQQGDQDRDRGGHRRRDRND